MAQSFRSRLAPLAVVAVALAPARAAAQERTVAGVVVDQASGRPLPDAQVSVDGSDRAARTDDAGRFRLTGVPARAVALRVMRIGYRMATVPVAGAQGEVQVAMAASAINLDQVVVTGTPDQQQRRAIGNAVGTVDVAGLVELAPQPNAQRLINTVPGVRVMSAGGDVGAGANTRVRGASSMALLSEPLVYIDGVRANNAAYDQGLAAAGVAVDSRFAPSRVNDVNPDDIESIEIIKGPAAATLYGTEASNGVINIITKRGRRGTPAVTLLARQGASWLPDPEKSFPPVYYRSASGEIVEFNVLRSDRVTGEYPGDTISYGPWFRTGRPQGYEASVGGGAEALGYFFSGGWDRDEGAVTYNWKNRLRSRANLTFTPGNAFSVDFNLAYLKSRYRSAGAQQPVTAAILWACPTPGCEPGRNLPNGVDGPTRGYLLYLPERYEDDVAGYEDLDRGTVGLTARFRPTGWLSQRLTVGTDYTSQDLSELYRRIDGIGTLFPNGRKDVQHTASTYLSADYAATAAFDARAGLRSESAVGFQYYGRQRQSTFARGDVFALPQLETVSAGALKSAAETFAENKTVGAYVQQQVSWNNRVFLTGAVRGDDNSAFGKNYDFVVYPKVSASWVVSEEPFARGLPGVASLRLRAAWGRAGQQPDEFAALRTYAPRVGEGGTPTLSPENLGNPDLEPEVGQELEVGLDAGLFGDRLGIELTRYDKRTLGAIVQVPVVPSAGFPGSQFRNIGRITNRGVEVGLTAGVLRRPNAGLTLGAKYSTNRNEVADLGEIPSLVVNANFGQYHVPGFPLASLFQTRIVSAQLDTSGRTPRAVNLMCEGGERVPGTNFSRGGGAPVPCAQAPAVYWGSPLPRREGAVHATLTLWRDLQLFSQVDFVTGHTLESGDIRSGLFVYRNQRAILEARDPILLGYDVLDTRRQPGIIDAGFAKLRDVSASYTLPERWARRAGATRATLTLSGQNLWTIWVAQRSDFGVRQTDPEVRRGDALAGDPGGLSAFNQEGLPQLRRFLTTLRVTL